jgi:hypothetical protein
MSKWLGIFDKRPLIWFHYVLLTGFLFVSFYIGQVFLSLSSLDTFSMFLFWLAVLWVGDSLIHYFLGVD